MTKEPGAEAQSQGCPAKRHYLTKRDIIGIVMGVPVFLLGFGALNGFPGAWWVGVIAMLISVGLFIPSRLYERGKPRAIGFVALGSAVAVSTNCVVLSALVVWGLMSHPDFEFAMFLIVIGVGSLLSLVCAILSIVVLMFKLRPGRTHGRIGVSAGIAVGLLHILLVYLLLFRDW